MHEGAEITVSEFSCSGNHWGPLAAFKLLCIWWLFFYQLVICDNTNKSQDFITVHHSHTISHEAPSNPPDLWLTLTSIWGKGPREFSATLMGGITQSLFCLRRPLELLLPEPENKMTGGGAGKGSFSSRLTETLSSSFVTFKTTQGFI